MPTDTIGQTTGIGQSPLAQSAALTGAVKGRGATDLTSQDFFKLMISELRQQDPLAPAKTSDMINNVSQIRSIELSGKLDETLASLANQQRTSGVADLLGKYVIASQPQSDGTIKNTQGVVTSVKFNSDGTAMLELDTGDSVRATDVTQVTTLEQAERAAQFPNGAATALAQNASEAAAGNGAAAGAANSGLNPNAAKPKSWWNKWLSLDGTFRL